MNELIPLYSASGRRVGQITELQMGKMLESGLIVRIVRASKDLKIKRVIRRALAGEGSVHTFAALAGTKYSFHETLDSGCRAWALMDLTDLDKHAIGERADLHRGIPRTQNIPGNWSCRSTTRPAQATGRVRENAMPDRANALPVAGGPVAVA